MGLTGKLQSIHPLWIGLGVSAAAALLGVATPADAAATIVGVWFLFATAGLCLARGQDAGAHGLSLGGLLDPSPLSVPHALRAFARAIAMSGAVMLIVTPAYVVGFVWWFQPDQAFDLRAGLQLNAWGLPSGEMVDLILGHVLVVALPEEAFFRGYLQSALDRRWPPSWSFWGVRLGPALFVSSAIFALGHVASVPEPGRLAVFFPSLLFGWLRSRTGGIGSSILTHAACNLLVVVLVAGFRL